jgi:hypothetical protein
VVGENEDLVADGNGGAKSAATRLQAKILALELRALGP